jgi:hypothetical protein
MNDAGWIAMKELYQREYWKRVWIVQEVCLAREAIVLCGKTQIPWSYISQVRKTRNHIWTTYLSCGELDFRRSLTAQLDDARVTSRTKGCSLWTLLGSSTIHDVKRSMIGYTASWVSQATSPPAIYRSIILSLRRNFSKTLCSFTIKSSKMMCLRRTRLN